MKRIRMSKHDYNELTASRDWCLKQGMTGLVEFYNETLAMQAQRRVLPPDAPEARAAADEERSDRGNSRQR